ncbi:MAG: glutathione S-transferase N-terminal domain-containing protein [Rhodobiaceae bacterium]|nr:glutathione S-transferase N-terminal domain-containing protein [Rhodobiaceae bacterium]
MIDLYAWGTPNGLKPVIALEEMGLDYAVHTVNITKGEQHEADFLAISPNGKIPAIVDRDNGDFAVFESGAILIYLGDRTGKFLPGEEKPRSIVIQWLMFQMASIGPMMGQSNFFTSFYKEDVPVGIERYQTEVRRLFGVMDARLKDNAYMAGTDYTIADIATWPWIRAWPFGGVDIADFANLTRWYDTIADRPAVKTALERLPGHDPKAFAAELQAKRKATMAQA